MDAPGFFTPALLHWYARNGRDLPWRHTADPYAIWLSEVILQQTRVSQGMPYYQAFLETFPTVQALAAADEAEVLRLWQGLGYYSRARNLHQTARQLTSEYGGTFPNTYQGLLRLRGIGPYTAAAIASFAFREPVAVLDGNVYRVLARVFGIETDISSLAARTEFSALANALIDRRQPDTFNHAIMDFGATQCVPVSPKCLFCPMQPHCVAAHTGRQHLLPVKTIKAAIRSRYFHYLVLQQGDRLAFVQRQPGDIWQGLYDFPLVEAPEPLELAGILAARPQLLAGTPAGGYGPVTHVLTHQRLQARFFQFDFSGKELPAGLGKLVWADETAATQLPKPVLVVRYLEYFFQEKTKA